MLYLQGRVIRTGDPAPMVRGGARRMTTARRGVASDQGEIPFGAQVVVESMTAVIGLGTHDSAVDVMTIDQIVSPTSGRARIDTRCGASAVTGARTSDP